MCGSTVRARHGLPFLNMSDRNRTSLENAASLLGVMTIPFLPRFCVKALADFLGYLTFRFSKRDRRIAFANLDIAFGDSKSRSEKEKIFLHACRNFSLLILDYYWFYRFTSKRLEKYVTVGPVLAKVLEEPPCMLLGAHYGNWEVIGLAVAHRGHEMLSVAKPLKNEQVDTIMNTTRTRTGQSIAYQKGGARAILRTIKNKGFVGLLMDQNTLPEDGGQFVSFFDRHVPMPSTVGLLKSKTGVRVALLESLPDKRGHYNMDVIKVDFLEELDDKDITSSIASAIEDQVRTKPEYWLWSYKRWKYRLEGDPADRYPFYSKLYEPPANETKDPSK